LRLEKKTPRRRGRAVSRIKNSRDREEKPKENPSRASTISFAHNPENARGGGEGGGEGTKRFAPQRVGWPLSWGPKGKKV